MNKEILDMLRSKNLEERSKKIRKILTSKEAELEKMQRECKHQIIVFTEEEKCYGSYDDALYQKCLFCRIESAIRRAFVDVKYVIDVSNYKREDCLKREEKFNIVSELYIKIANENEELSNVEIAKLVQEQLNKENEEFQKIMDEIHQRIYNKC